VSAAVIGPAGPAVLRSRYLVACDAGHSTARRLTGVPFPGRAGTMSAVTADVEPAAASATAGSGPADSPEAALRRRFGAAVPVSSSAAAR
jgi:2-polyprenyl-6-methoxyphenol hydroxylase-like FAD-dependent oxidoreductase